MLEKAFDYTFSNSSMKARSEEELVFAERNFGYQFMLLNYFV